MWRGLLEFNLGVDLFKWQKSAKDYDLAENIITRSGMKDSLILP